MQTVKNDKILSVQRCLNVKHILSFDEASLTVTETWGGKSHPFLSEKRVHKLAGTICYLLDIIYRSHLRVSLYKLIISHTPHHQEATITS